MALGALDAIIDHRVKLNPAAQLGMYNRFLVAPKGCHPFDGIGVGI